MHTINEWFDKFEKMSINDKENLRILDNSLETLLLDDDIYNSYPELEIILHMIKRSIKFMDKF